MATSRGPMDFHGRLPGYSVTPLVEAGELASLLGVGEVLVKVESERLGLPSFKMLGASWAVYKALVERLGHGVEPWRDMAELAQRFHVLRPLSLVAATDGNHGRAVARVAGLLGFDAEIFVPRVTSEERIRSIRDEGGTVTIVDGTYDDAIARSAREAGEHKVLISDTSWPGYEVVPRWVIEGYSTIWWEAEEQMRRRVSEEAGWEPDVIFVQIGVGAFAASAIDHFRSTRLNWSGRIVGVEPTVAACALASARAGHPVMIGESQDSIMAGLNCGTPSLVAWQSLQSGIDAFMTIGDGAAGAAMRWLASVGIESGESGAAGLGGAMDLLAGDDASRHRRQLEIGPSARVLLICTEGATDRRSYDNIVRRGVASRSIPQ
ncbi:MAG: diaminopropionate ammonia-lyase [Candidatus Dormibacteria bacterium]